MTPQQPQSLWYHGWTRNPGAFGYEEDPDMPEPEIVTMYLGRPGYGRFCGYCHIVTIRLHDELMTSDGDDARKNRADNWRALRKRSAAARAVGALDG